MSKNLVIRRATTDDAHTVGSLVYTLIRELVPENEEREPKESYIETARRLLENHPGFWTFVAQLNNDDIGVLTLNECAAIYAGGAFGEICELYVAPASRSAGVGAKLIDQAVEFGKSKSWSTIEVGAPDVPRWQKSVDFYLAYGFKMIGPRLELGLTPDRA